jgi:hypothetical protein
VSERQNEGKEQTMQDTTGTAATDRAQAWKAIRQIEARLNLATQPEDKAALRAELCAAREATR